MYRKNLAHAPNAVSPLLELGAYEALWLEQGATFKSIAEKFRQHPGCVPTDLVMPHVAEKIALQVIEALKTRGSRRFGIRINGAGEYPESLRDAQHPIEILYYQGWWDLVGTRSVSVVGTRKPSNDGMRRAAKIAIELVKANFTVVSGLARGIDTVAHEAAIAEGGRTIAVIGTPLCFSYPPENVALQRQIDENFLLISQIPILRYIQQNPRQNRFFFPERNITMSALTEATVIVEAGETSGTLTQARAALQQGRKLFILNSCFLDPRITWPKRLEGQGAIRVRDADDMMRELGA